MARILGILTVLIAFGLLLIIGSITAFTVGSKNRINSISPSPTVTALKTQTPSPSNAFSISPTPTSSTTVQGQIIDIAENQVEYKNATIVTIKDTSGTSIKLYVSPQTTIYNTQEQPIELPQVNVGMTVIAQGNPTSGGFDVAMLSVLK